MRLAHPSLLMVVHGVGSNLGQNRQQTHRLRRCGDNMASGSLTADEFVS